MRMPFIGLACSSLNIPSLGINFSIICQYGFGGSFDSCSFPGVMTKYRANFFVCQFRIRGTKLNKNNHMERNHSADRN